MSVGSLTEQALGNYATYAEYVAQTVQAQPTGTVSQIPNELKSVASQIAILTDPVRIQAVKASIANQMNEQSGGPTFVDLSERIADVQIETVAQGAGTLKITLIDPDWKLISGEDENGNTFIQADDLGFLWPPIDINFPHGTDCVWRLCQVNASTFVGEPNMILTFEDRVVSWLRETNANPHMGGVAQGAPDATLGGFIKELVDGANQYVRGHPAASGSDWTPIRLVELISPRDPNYNPPVQAPASATKPNAAISRQNPNKNKQGLTAPQQAYINQHRGIPINRGETLLQAESSFGGLRP